jgi:NADPH:quinone reductase-like Zn-dependent oxidoreductase
VHASSVNPVDNSIAAGLLAQMGVQYEYRVTLGRDYTGVVEHTGAAVSDYKPDDQVFGFLLHANLFGFLLHANRTARAGAWAELITVTEELSIAPAPDVMLLITRANGSSAASSSSRSCASASRPLRVTRDAWKGI